MTGFPRIWIAFFLLFVSSTLRAHDALPIALTLNQVGQQEYTLTALFPPTYPRGLEPRVDADAPCTSLREASAVSRIRCPVQTQPTALLLGYPGPTGKSPLLLRIIDIQGHQQTVVAPPGTIRIDLPEQRSRWQVFLDYFGAGTHHLLGGFDHLLFLVCLMLLARRPVPIAWTVTGFTAGHALTLSLATLGLVLVDSGTVEILIALSIIFVAAEIARGRRDTLAWRKPWLVSTLFGLLHGLGFAGALREIGLPPDQVPLALAAFNCGIEAGQLVFVLAVAGIYWAFNRVWRADQRMAFARTTLPEFFSWPIGIVASTWFFMRMISLAG